MLVRRAFAMGRPFSIIAAATFNASPAKVFAVAEDLARWNDWSPFFRMETGVASEVSTPSSGVGAHYTWSGKRTGRGRMEVLETTPGERVVLNLEFIEPFKAVNRTVFTLTPTASGGTHFKWEMSGERPLVMVIVAALLRLDNKLADDFVAGLGLLRGIVDGA